SADSPVSGSIRWWSERAGPKRLASRPEVATPPLSRARTASLSPPRRGSATATSHGPLSGGCPRTAMSPPSSTSPPAIVRGGGAGQPASTGGALLLRGAESPMHLALAVRPRGHGGGAGRADRAPFGAMERAHPCTTAEVAVVAWAGALRRTSRCLPPGPFTT